MPPYRLPQGGGRRGREVRGSLTRRCRWPPRGRLRALRSLPRSHFRIPAGDRHNCGHPPRSAEKPWANPMTNAGKYTLGILLLLSAVLAAYWSIYLPITERDFLRRYAAAVALSPTGAAPSPAWDHRIVLPDGRVARILARGGMGGSVEVSYGPSERDLVYRSVDYIYPAELKLSPDGRFLFATVRGLASGVFERRRSYVFDLHDRVLVSRHRLPVR